MQFDWVNVQQCLQTLQFQRCECVARHRVGELHATFFDSRPDGSYALPPMEQSVAQSVAPPMEQSVAYQRHDMVGTLGAGELPPDAQCPHLAARPPAHRARGGIHAPR